MVENRPWKSWEETDGILNGNPPRMVLGTCSYKPRPRLQSNHIPHAGTKLGDNAKDVWHVQKSGVSTLCGIDCSEWCRMGEVPVDWHLCDRCRKKLP